MLVIIYLFTFFSIKIRPTIVSVATARASNSAIRTINNVANATITELDITYEDLVLFKTNPQGQITAFSSNIVKINQIKAILATKIQSAMEKEVTLKTKIPLGTLMGYDVFSGLGPKIPITLMPVGYADIDVKSHFSAAGINQTKHEIELLITARTNVLLPMKNTEVEVATQIPLVQTIIVGTVPDTYTNVTDEDPSEGALFNITP